MQKGYSAIFSWWIFNSKLRYFPKFKNFNHLFKLTDTITALSCGHVSLFSLANRYKSIPRDLITWTVVLETKDKARNQRGLPFPAAWSSSNHWSIGNDKFDLSEIFPNNIISKYDPGLSLQRIATMIILLLINWKEFKEPPMPLTDNIRRTWQ